MTAGPIPCAYCDKTFVDEIARWMHTRTKHYGRKNPHPEVMRAKSIEGQLRRDAEDADESFADRAVQAEIDRACGIDNPDIDWLLP
jgi:hypothetical protein